MKSIAAMLAAACFSTLPVRSQESRTEPSKPLAPVASRHAKRLLAVDLSTSMLMRGYAVREIKSPCCTQEMNSTRGGSPTYSLIASSGPDGFVRTVHVEVLATGAPTKANLEDLGYINRVILSGADLHEVQNWLRENLDKSASRAFSSASLRTGTKRNTNVIDYTLDQVPPPPSP